jgi:hypothetical protein
MATTSDEMGRLAERPANSVLASGRETPIRLPPWRRGLSDYLARRRRPASEEPRPRRRRTSRRQPVLDPRARGEEIPGEEQVPSDEQVPGDERGDAVEEEA